MTTIPKTYVEGICLAIMLRALGYGERDVAIAAVDGVLHVGLPAHKIHFDAGYLPPADLSPNEAATMANLTLAWDRHRCTFNALSDPEKKTIYWHSTAYHRREEFVREFTSRHITPPALQS